MLYLLDYGAGNVQSLANSLQKLGYPFRWITEPSDFSKASSLIFPGVGAFQTAVETLHQKQLFVPLREYIESGKPYFGICIGMQVLFASSTESPTHPGLAIIPSPIQKFDSHDKPVPHIGWNTAGGSTHYYFVHSFCAPGTLKDWTYTTTQYGNESFTSSVRKGNVFGTQFHPEKSGAAGLNLLDSWLKGTLPPTPPATSPSTLTKRIIACMDVRTNDQGDLVVTKGDQYDVREKSSTSAVRNLGKPITLASQYYTAGADELTLLNITSFRHSPLRDQPMLDVVRAAAQSVFVPLTIGGGIKDTIDPDGTKHTALEVASLYFRAGADKVSLGSDAVYAVEALLARGGAPDGSSAIESIAHAYGRQAVVVSIDPRRVYLEEDPSTYTGPGKDELVSSEGKTWWYACTVSGGRETRSLTVTELARGVELLGAGELLVNSIDRDGTGLGFDLDLLRLIKKNVSIPVIASSGAGKAEHFLEVFRETGVEAALAAGIFHRSEVGIDEVKGCLQGAGMPVRAI